MTKDKNEVYTGLNKLVEEVDMENVKALILGMFELAVWDLTYKGHQNESPEFVAKTRESARAFLFDDNVVCPAFGGVSPRGLLGSVGMDLDYVRDGLKRRLKGCEIKRVVKKKVSMCTIKDCGYISVAKGLCKAHYQRLKQHGDPLVGGPIKRRK